jgi:hypothetical protein
MDAQFLGDSPDAPALLGQLSYRFNHTHLQGIAHIFRLYAFSLRKRKIEADLRLKVVHFEVPKGGTL